MPQFAGLPAHADRQHSGHAPRVCGTCTLCCRLPEIDAFSKPANVWCTHCVAGKGCTIYADRPKLCRDFLCAWRIDHRLGPEWEPSIAHMMVYDQGRQITVLVDPDHPHVWRTQPYQRQLRQWAADVEELGIYIIVFVGDAVFKVDPEPVASCGDPRARLPVTAGA